MSVWENALDRLSKKISAHSFDMWVRPVVLVATEPDRLILRAPTETNRTWFEKHYLALIRDLIREETGREYALVVEPPPAGASASPVAARFEPPPAPLAPLAPERTFTSATLGSQAPLSASGLNPRYLFESFVAGPSNQLAYAAARAVATAEAPRYNPLFLWGAAGVGKTHLLHAIGNEILRVRPDARVLYLSVERFINEYVHAVRTQTMHDFRTRFREGCDVILLDDVQYISAKEATQEELFHTFNELHSREHLVVLSADRKPHEIQDIHERLRTRFGWGLTADIEPPELEVRIAILRKKAEQEGVFLESDVAYFIADQVKSNVRELEGALVRLLAFASLSGSTITLEFARKTLLGALARPATTITTENILRAVAEYYSVKVADLLSERRPKNIVLPRAVAMYLAYKHTGRSYPELSTDFKKNDHTTIRSANLKIKVRLEHDTSLRGEIQSLEAKILR